MELEVTIDGVKMVSVEDAAKNLSKAEITIWRWIRDGKLETKRTDDRTYIPVTELERMKKL